MALVRDECLLPCKDAPELGYAKESSAEQYVPDVFFKVACLYTIHGHRTLLSPLSRRSTDGSFVDSLFIQQDKDKFGNDVTFLARPLPVEYLIIDVRVIPHSRASLLIITTH